MKTIAFNLVAAPTLANAQSMDDRLFAYDCLLVIARALGLKREVNRLRALIAALRAADELQADFLEVLKPESPKRPRNRDGHNGDGQGGQS